MTAARFGWLVSYPKSGNTWLRMMLSSLQSGGKPVDINALQDDSSVATFAEVDELFGLEASELIGEEIADLRPALCAALAADADGGLLLRKVHDRFWRTGAGEAAFPPQISQGAVYLVRDPRDVAVSFSHHRGTAIDRTIEFMANDGAFMADAASGAKIQLPQPLGSWSGHVLSWLDQTSLSPLVIRYEDMLRDPHGLLAQVASHLGIAVTDAMLDSAVAATRFETLAGQERIRGFRERQSESTDVFFRTGRGGGWRDRLSSAQARAIVERHGAVMDRLGYL
ncbi:MAG: sulfotransferase domain-containing protein [Rhizomicrobium sp.]